MTKKTKKINVTQSLLPNREQFHQYVDKILDSGWLTNRGQCLRQLEEKLQLYLGVRNVVLVNNATTALQIAYRALAIQNEIITSPFTFIATASSAKWEGLDVIFADIDAATFNITTETIQQQITNRTSAIMPVHVFGNPCDVESIASLAQQYNLKVIYDAAHAFGVKYRGESVLQWGDISILSFHATKLFHTIEGGALIIKDDMLCEQVRKMINFGFTGPESIACLGINAKMNEFQAAMGLCLLADMDEVINKRKNIIALYDSLLSLLSAKHITKQSWSNNSMRNNSYYPILFANESITKHIQKILNAANIFPRRYFYPSLDTLDFLVNNKQLSPVARDIACRILCLPLYADLSDKDCKRICDIIICACMDVTN